MQIKSNLNRISRNRSFHITIAVLASAMILMTIAAFTVANALPHKKMYKKIEWLLDKAKGELNLDDAQVDALERILTKSADNFIEKIEQRAKQSQKIWLQDSIDTEDSKQIVEQFQESKDDMAEVFIESLPAIHAILTPSQREQFADLATSGKWIGHRKHGWKHQGKHHHDRKHHDDDEHDYDDDDDYGKY